MVAPGRTTRASVGRLGLLGLRLLFGLWLWMWMWLGVMTSLGGGEGFVTLRERGGDGPAGGGEGEAAVVAADRVIVRFRDEAVGAVRALAAGDGGVRWIAPRARVGLAGGRAEGAAALTSLAVVRLPRGTRVADGLEVWRRRPEVLYAEPVLRVHLAVEPGADRERVPSDFGFGRQWSLHNTGQTGGLPGADIGALAAWKVTTGSPEVVVAIVDTGVDFFHPDLAANIWVNPREVPGNGVDDDGNGYIDDVRGYDFVWDDADPMDDNVHGTHVAGILGAVGDDENGVAGVAWSVRMMALKAFDETGSGTLDDTLAAIAYARLAGARIINASWGTSTRSRALDELVAESVRAGVVFVAAAGNNGSDVRFYPAATPEAIAVGATDAHDRSPTFSNYGSFVDLVAPGDGIESTIPGGGWSTLSGTSMAAPHVSGLVALLLSRRPEMTPTEVSTLLRSTTRELETDRNTGAGRIDAGLALSITEPLPEARMEVPAVLSGRLDVRGVVRGPGLAGYRLELGAGARPTRWEELASHAGPDAAGVLLGGFDTARFDDGEYTLRLTASNGVGHAAIERVQVTVANVQLVSPENNDVLRLGDRLEVRGTMFGEGREYTVSWGVGRQPARWETNGVERVGEGLRPVVNSVLAHWDTGRVGTGGFVTLRLQATLDGRVVGESFARMVYMEPHLRAGWPKRLPFGDEFPAASWREFNVADLDGDGTKEVVLVDHGESGGRAPRLLVLGPDAEVRWFRDLPAGAPEHDAPVIGDLDGDGRLEIVVDTGDRGEISVFDADGHAWGGAWPVSPGGTHFGKVLADLDGDGRLELVALSRPPPDLVGTRRFPLVVIDAAGTVVRRWTVRGCETESLAPEALPAVVNLDEDPELEIVVVEGCGEVSAFDLGREEGPVWVASTEARLLASPVVADLDGDGAEEIVVVASRREEGRVGGIHVLDGQGRPRRGWPVLADRSFPGGPAIADLNGDGKMEIVVAAWEESQVHAVGVDGFELPGWPTLPLFNASLRSVPVVGDVDGDGRPDVVVPSQGSWFLVVFSGEVARSGGIRAWRGDGSPIDFQPGTPVEGWVMETASGATWNRMPPAVLTDLDGNGRLDIVAASIQDRSYWPTAPLARAKMRSSLYAWELPVPAPSEPSTWSAFQGGPRRDGRWTRVLPPNVPPRILGIPDQTIAPGDGFRGVPLDLYVEDLDGRRDRLEWTVTSGARIEASVDAGRVMRVAVRDEGWVGRETVELRVRDPRGGEARATVTFEVRPGYRPPLAIPDSMVVVEDESGELDLLSNDRSPTGRPLRLVAVSRPGFGSTQRGEGGRVIYRPTTNYHGMDRFEYTVLDDDGGGATGEVSVEVVGRNDAPTPQPDRVLMDEDNWGEFSLLANDVDVDGDPLVLETVHWPALGIWETVGPDRYRFLPPTNYHGQVSFFYTVEDPSGLTATGEVAVLVQPVNDPPVAKSQELVLNRNRSVDVFYETTDPDGDELVYTVVDGPENGVLLAYPNLANYAPKAGFAGGDRFTYTASDGVSTVGPVEVSFRIEPRNNPPEVRGRSMVTAQAQALSIGLEVLDADGDEVVLETVSGPAHGQVIWQGTNLVYTPDLSFVGEDLLRVRARDAQEAGAAVEVLIRVTDVNTPPVAVAEVLTVARNQASSIRLRATDAENNPLSYTVVSNVVYGTLTGSGPGFEYTPVANFRGIDRFRFLASDGRLSSEPVWVHMVVRDPNQAAITTNQWVKVSRDTAVKFRLEARDPEGQPMQAVILKGPGFGRIHGSGVDYTYVPGAGFVGSDRFTYRVWDGLGYSADATVALEVAPPVEVPVEILAPGWGPNGFGFVVRSTPGAAVRVEVSVDLVAWETVAVWTNGSGSEVWVDSAGEAGEARFYRVRREP